MVISEGVDEAIPDEPPTATPGTYVSLGRIAKGGMGQVELAFRRQGRFKRLFAVKRMHSHLVDDPDARQMFLEEARIAGLLAHPNVIGVNDMGEDARGPFLVMDYVDGLSLSAVIRLAREKEHLVPIQVVARIGREVAAGLHAAHSLRDHDGNPLELVHRDVSPSNVLVSWDGGVRITDFGVAKALGRSLKTSTGVLKGKVSYMSPEQLKFRKLDHRSDIFSLGVVLYELLTTERLYQNDEDNEGIRRILEEPPPDVGEVRAGVPPSLVALMFSLLAKEPEDRPADASEVARQLETVLAQVLTDEPPIDLGTWLTGLAGTLRDERRSVIERTLAEAEEKNLAPLVTLGSVHSDAPTRRRHRGARAWIWAGAIAAVIIVGTGGWLAWTATRGSTSTVEPPATISANPPVPSPTHEQTATAADPTTGAADENEPVPGDVPPSPATEAGEPDQTSAMARGMRRRRGRGRMRTQPDDMESTTSPLQLRQSWGESE
jgi:serine/threonine-protein kinase